MTDTLNIFETSTVQYDKAIRDGNYKIANKYQDSIVKTIVSLHEGNKLLILERFLYHEVFSTRLWAAFALLPIETAKCDSVLESLASSNQLGSLDARIVLEQWKDASLVFPYESNWKW